MNDGVGGGVLRPLAAAWLLLRHGAADGATNMATDVALLEHAARTGEATLRLYGWSAPTLSFGRHERALGAFTPERLADARVSAVRRPTGGRALLHHREVTYSITAPAAGSSLATSAHAINALLADALAHLGVTVHPHPRPASRSTSRPLRPDGAACFAEPSTGELVLDGAKLVGSAQVREGGAFLQHGSILLDDDQSAIATLRSREAPAPLARVATLRAALGRPVGKDEVIAALVATFDALATREGVTSRSMVASESGITDRARELRARFEDPAWTWRR